MCEEAHAAEARGSVLAGLRPITRRVEPGLEHAMGVLTALAASTSAASAEVRAGGAGVMEPPRVATTGLLARVSVGTLGPVMRPPAGAPPDLELVHTKIVAAEHAGRREVKGRVVVAGEEELECECDLAKEVRGQIGGKAGDATDRERCVGLHHRHGVVGEGPRRGLISRGAVDLLAGHHLWDYD